VQVALLPHPESLQHPLGRKVFRVGRRLHPVQVERRERVPDQEPGHLHAKSASPMVGLQIDADLALRVGTAEHIQRRAADQFAAPVVLHRELVCAARILGRGPRRLAQPSDGRLRVVIGAHDAYWVTRSSLATRTQPLASPGPNSRKDTRGPLICTAPP
jgi:hypothetical protein